QRVGRSPVVRRQGDDGVGLASCLSNLGGVQATQRLARVFQEQGGPVWLPPALDRLLEVADKGGCARAVWLDELEEENAVVQALQAMQPLQHVHGVASATQAGRPCQVLNHDQRRHPAPRAFWPSRPSNPRSDTILRTAVP